MEVSLLTRCCVCMGGGGGVSSTHGCTQHAVRAALSRVYVYARGAPLLSEAVDKHHGRTDDSVIVINPHE